MGFVPPGGTLPIYSKITEVREYISNQMNHHRKMSFQEEYRFFLRKHSLDFDEAHVWD